MSRFVRAPLGALAAPSSPRRRRAPQPTCAADTKSQPPRRRRGPSSRPWRSRRARSSIASQRIYFVMTDRYANGDPANDRGGRTGTRSVTGYDPADTGWFHGGDFRGLTGGCTTGHRPRADQGARLHRGLGDAAVRPEGRAGLERRLPRLLDPRLHVRRSAPRHERGLRRLRRVRAPPRAEGLSSTSSSTTPPTSILPSGSGYSAAPVPRLPRQGVQPGAVRRRQDVPLPEGRQLPARPGRPAPRTGTRRSRPG